jgi:hydrogenase maturation protease
MSDPRGPLAIVGVGNVLRGDDGVGVHVASARALLIVDAADIAGPPGTVAVVNGDAVRSPGARLSPAASDGVGELVDAARLTGTLPPAFSLVCIRPATTETGPDLSGQVRASLGAAVVATLHEARRLDARTSAPASAAPDGRDLVGASA